MKIALQLSILYVCLVKFIYSTKFVYSSEKNIFEGTVDNYNKTLLDRRIVENISEKTYKLYDWDVLDRKLGVEDWGPISNSLLMTKYPDNYNKQ